MVLLLLSLELVCQQTAVSPQVKLMVNNIPERIQVYEIWLLFNYGQICLCLSCQHDTPQNPNDFPLLFVIG